MVFMRENVRTEPGEQCFFIGPAEFADLRDRADLRAVSLNGTSFPGILGKERGINAYLGSEKANHFRSCLLPGTQETAFILEALE
jgi:hypothetical protein